MSADDEEEAHRKHMARLRGMTGGGADSVWNLKSTVIPQPKVKKSNEGETEGESEAARKYREKMKEMQDFHQANESILNDPFGLEMGEKKTKPKRTSIMDAVDDPSLSAEARKAASALTRVGRVSIAEDDVRTIPGTR